MLATILITKPMTIVYLGEMTSDASDLADFLRGDNEHSVWFFTSAFHVMDWAADPRNVIVLFESAFASEAKKLTDFVTVEKKPEMSNAEIRDQLEAAKRG